MNENAIIEYNVTDASLAELLEKYDPHHITMKGKDDYEFVKRGITEVRSLRTSVEKKRKELKADALEWGRRVDEEAKRITVKLLEIEEPLKAKKKEVDDEKERIRIDKEKKEQERIDGLRVKVRNIESIVADIHKLNSDEIMHLIAKIESMELTYKEYQELLEEAQAAHERALESAKREYTKRVEVEKEEEKRKKAAEELNKQQEEMEKQKAELEKKRKEEEEKLAVEREKIESEKRKIEEQKLKERLEREAREKAEREAKEKAEREEAERKAEEEQRKIEEARKPEKEKIIAWRGKLDQLIESAPKIKDSHLKACLGKALNHCKSASEEIAQNVG